MYARTGVTPKTTRPLEREKNHLATVGISDVPEWQCSNIILNSGIYIPVTRQILYIVGQRDYIYIIALIFFFQYA